MDLILKFLHKSLSTLTWSYCIIPIHLSFPQPFMCAFTMFVHLDIIKCYHSHSICLIIFHHETTVYWIVYENGYCKFPFRACFTYQGIVDTFFSLIQKCCCTVCSFLLIIYICEELTLTHLCYTIYPLNGQLFVHQTLTFTLCLTRHDLMNANSVCWHTVL